MVPCAIVLEAHTISIFRLEHRSVRSFRNVRNYQTTGYHIRNVHDLDTAFKPCYLTEIQGVYNYVCKMV